MTDQTATPKMRETQANAVAAGISDAERNYEIHEWDSIEKLPDDATSLSPYDLYRFCNSTSQAFADFVKRQRTDDVILLDYELLGLDLDPSFGSHISQSETGICLTVYTNDGSRYFRMRSPFQKPGLTPAAITEGSR